MRVAGGDNRDLGPGLDQWSQEGPAPGGQYQACTSVWGRAHWEGVCVWRV